jgi:5-dehydro-4-deoxyglucarate dehydratase
MRGVVAFAPTPFESSGQLDATALAQHIAHLSSARLAAIVVCGAVGEFYALSEAEHTQVLDTAVRASAGRVPILLGVGHSSEVAARLAGAAAAHGAAGVLVNPPYFVRPDIDGLAAHYRQIARAGLGMVAFSTSSFIYTTDMLRTLADIPELVAVKDEYGDLEMFSASVNTLDDRYLWINGMGEELAADYAARGAAAMTSGIVNLDPSLSINVFDAASAGDIEGCSTAIASRIAPIAALRRSRPGYQTTVLKEAMAILGRCGPTVRLPLVPLRDDERASLRRHLSSAGFRTGGGEPLHV